MITSLDIALKYMKHYKNRSLSILFSIILAVALIVGIGTLYNSAKYAYIERVRMETSDYHFCINANQSIYSMIKKDKSVAKIGVTKYFDSAKEPNLINIIQTDNNYIKMCNSTFLKGRLPENKGEIALEEWVLQNFDINPVLGEKITLDLVEAKQCETYTVVGILEDIPQNKNNNIMKGYIALNQKEDNLKMYVKFNERYDLYKQLNSLCEKAKIHNEDISVNRELLNAMDIYTYTPTITSREGISYIINRYHLDLIGIILLICLFSSFVIYSVFNISTLQRITDYGVIEALGASNLTILTLLMSELIVLFVIGFPIGTMIGIFAANWLNSSFSSVLIGQDIQSAQLQISIKYILIGATFLFVLLFFIGIKLMKKLNRFTIIEAIKKKYRQESTKLTSKKLYTLKNGKITKSVSFIYIVKNKVAFISILFSLSLGGSIFICSDYAGELTKRNNELEIKVDCDLNSDYQISMVNTNFDEGISNAMISKLSDIEGTDHISPIRYYYGGIIINDDFMLSKVLWDAYNEDSYIKNSFGGIYTKINDGSNNYLLRTGIYGYDNHMLNLLKDYILEGEIDVSKMKRDNLVLFKQIQDGGNGLYDMIDVKPGDIIAVKYQKEPRISEEALKFEDGPEYVLKEYVVAATLKRVAVSNENFIGDSGEDIIMTNDQFQKDFGIETYNMVSITKKEDANHIDIANKINDVIKDVSQCSMRDLTVEIAKNNAFINKQLMFLYGVTFILFIISIFNILNNINYNVLSRTNEFGLLRAMGITDGEFWQMIIHEGILYGIIASGCTVITSLLGQFAVFYLVKIEYSYIDPQFTINVWKYLMIILLNVTIAIFATILPSRKIVKTSIVEEIRRQE